MSDGACPGGYGRLSAQLLTMLREIRTGVSTLDELGSNRRSEATKVEEAETRRGGEGEGVSQLIGIRAQGGPVTPLTPVPLSTTKGTEGSDI